MIYLIGKIVLSLLASLAIGFGMAWALQMHLAARLREQLNSVIFETKSRIPQLESEITNRDQVIDGLREDLAKKPKEAPIDNMAGSKEQEKQIDQLRQQIMDLETELKAARGVTHEESVLELDGEDREHTEEPELAEDEEFLNDISDIFEDADASTEEESHQSLEDELQSELEGWDGAADTSSNEPKNAATTPADGQPAAHDTSAPVNLKSELLGLGDKTDADSTPTPGTSEPLDDSERATLQEEVKSLNEARKELSETVDSQAKEMSTLRQQRELQDKSLGVLNQQLELARMANERILRELREVKDAKAGTKAPANIKRGDQSRSASNG